MTTAIRLLLGVLLVALPAAAQAWNDCGNYGTYTDLTSNSVRPGVVVCHDTVAATATDSAMMDTRACDHIQVMFDPDLYGSTAVAEAYVYTCTLSEVNTTNCTKLLVDTDGDGVVNDVTLNGTDMRTGIAWANAAWVWVDMTVAPGTAKIARTMISCF